MLVSRSGHACSLLTSHRSKILVSGIFTSLLLIQLTIIGHPVGGSSKDHGKAMTSNEVYDVGTNKWTQGHDMVQARYDSAISWTPQLQLLITGIKNFHIDV